MSLIRLLFIFLALSIDYKPLKGNIHDLSHATSTQNLTAPSPQKQTKCSKQQDQVPDGDLSSLSPAGPPTSEMYTVSLGLSESLWLLSWWKVRDLHLPVYLSPFPHRSTVYQAVQATSLPSVFTRCLASLSSTLAP